MAAAKPLPTVGTRISLAGSIGTIRYTGRVDLTDGPWLGVEWDELLRGKHDGVKDGKRYFDCLAPGSGSFIRPTAPYLDYGRSFLDALIDKYVEAPQGSSASEFVVLGSSKGAIQVEAVNLDKIRGKFADIERLKEVSLDRERVAYADEVGKIRQRCPNLKGVDLSFSLVPNWDTIASIAGELPFLERLVLNNNRLELFSPDLTARPFQRLTELRLNGTLTSWQAMLSVIPRMPALKHIEMGYNRLRTLGSGQPRGPVWPPLELINLDSNELSRWDSICHALRPMTQLKRLVLSANPLSDIPLPGRTPGLHPLPWRYLSLASTRVSSWESIEALSVWCPQLEGLSLHGTLLVEDPDNSRIWRQIAIARLPLLRVLDGTSVSDRERSDAELFYISTVARIEFESDEERQRAHPQWLALCQKYERPVEALYVAPKEDTLSSRLIQICAWLVKGTTPPSDVSILSSPTPTRVLPTMPLRLVRLKLLKSFKAPRGARAELWERMADGSFLRIGDPDGSEDGREIEWWLGEGAEVAICVQ